MIGNAMWVAAPVLCRMPKCTRYSFDVLRNRCRDMLDCTEPFKLRAAFVQFHRLAGILMRGTKRIAARPLHENVLIAPYSV